MAHIVRDAVREAPDRSAIVSVRGYPPRHPGMVVALLLFGHSLRLYSSRKLAHTC